jgi:transposase-like protein
MHNHRANWHARTHRPWPLEIKLEAVRLLQAGQPISEIAGALGIPTPRSIWHWRVELNRDAAADVQEQRRQRRLDAECRQRTMAMIRHFDRCRERRAYS